jgi:hypothetical protein
MAIFEIPKSRRGDDETAKTPGMLKTENKTPQTLTATGTRQASTIMMSTSSMANLTAMYTDNTTRLETFEVLALSTMQINELRIDIELRDEIREKSNQDEIIRGILKKLKNNITRDCKKALGLYKEKDRLLTYDRLM